MHFERLLRPDELQGLCRVPVQIRSLFNAEAWKAVSKRYVIRPMQGMDYLIEVAHIVGIKRDEMNSGTEISALNQMLEEDDILSGPIISINGHCYGLTIPAASHEAVVYNWQPLTAKPY
jgi:hypothetical protein